MITVSVGTVSASGSGLEHAGGMLERGCRVLEVVGRDGHVQDERAEAERHVMGELGADSVVAPHEVRTEGLVVLEGYEPVVVRVGDGMAAKTGQLLVPLRVRYLHRELVRDLSLAVLREAPVRDFPSLIGPWPRDDSDADSRRPRAVDC